jgi:hypothetical protein
MSSTAIAANLSRTSATDMTVQPSKIPTAAPIALNSSTTTINSANSSNTAVSSANYSATAVNSDINPKPATDTSSPSTAVTAVFNDTLAKFKKDLKRRDLTTFQVTTLDKLQQTIVDIQAKQMNTRRLQCIRRLEPFIEAMNQFGKVIEPFCNANEFVAFVWGPLKFLLLTAEAFSDAFNELLDVYEQIGEILPLFSQHEELFRDNSHMAEILPLVYKDILEVHRLSLKYFNKRLWRQLFNATWKTHKSKFGGLIDRMKRHRELVESQASLSQIRAFQEARQKEDERYETEVSNEELRRKKDVYLWLKPVNMDNEQFNLNSLRAQYPRTGQWLIKNEVFKKWLDPKFPTLPTLLWLNGQPGAGMSAISACSICIH